MSMVLDESETDPTADYEGISVIGGFFVDAVDVQEIVTAWRRHKQDLGMLPSEELKYNLSPGPVRARLESAGLSHRVRLPSTLDIIGNLPITLIGCAQLLQAKPRAGWLDGFDWCLTCAADQVSGRSHVDGHEVVIDQPSGLQEVPMCDALGTAAAESPFALYRERWTNGYACLPSSHRKHGPSLSSLGFKPELRATCSAHSDLVQIADHVAGVTRQVAERHLRGSSDDVWKDTNFCRVLPRFWQGSNRVAIAVLPETALGRDLLADALNRCAQQSTVRRRRDACCGRGAIACCTPRAPDRSSSLS